MNSLFHTSVIQKYVAGLDSILLDKKYKEFNGYFNNSDIQNNIRNSKEEQFQEGFFGELFVNIFGYTLNPSPEYNLISEQKNIDDSKKSDGAILKDSNVTAVIELKSTVEVDLDKIGIQAFGYKNHNPKHQVLNEMNVKINN